MDFLGLKVDYLFNKLQLSCTITEKFVIIYTKVAISLQINCKLEEKTVHLVQLHSFINLIDTFNKKKK